MKLNINSLSARLYRWFYANSKMPQSLCPYFWKLILMWVFILPYSILSLPVIIMERLDKSAGNSTGERAGVGFIIWFILFMLISMLSWAGLLFATPVKESLWSHILVTGALGWLASIIFGAIALFKWSKEKWENRKIKYDEHGYRIWTKPEPKQDSILVSFIKASYNKYCPKIDWK